MEKRVITLLGCTAVGKGTLARALARTLGGEILSLDSMKVYRGLDVGTAKPDAATRAALRHHLIDVADVWEEFSVARFVTLADAAVAEIHARGRPVVAVGGTLLYFKCWHTGLFAGPGADPAFREQFRERVRLEGLDRLHAELASVDAEAAERIHRNDQRRIERALEVYHLTGQPISTLQQQWSQPTTRCPQWDWTLLALHRPREENNRRINQRVRRMVAGGLVDEARRVWSDPRGVGPQARQAVGYAELFAHFEGQTSCDDALELVKVHTRRLAKQQRTWLKALRELRWIDATGVEDPADLVPAATSMLAP